MEITDLKKQAELDKLRKEAAGVADISDDLDDVLKKLEEKEKAADLGDALKPEDAQENNDNFTKVQVLRSSGEMEDGWVAVSLDPNEEGFVQVRKYEEKKGKKYIYKKVLLSDLKEWNGWKDTDPEIITAPDKEVEFTWETPKNGDAAGKEGKEQETQEPKDPLLEKLEDARKDFAKVEFENRNKWASVKKFFGLKGDKESDEVRYERERYEKTINEYRDSKVAELRVRSEAGEDIKKEMSDLLMMFRYKEVIDLADSRTQAKLDSFKDTFWGTIRSLPTEIAQAYNKIPLGVKLGLAGAAFLSGSVAFIAGRRILGGIVAGVGFSKGYEALDQKIMQKMAQAGTEVDLEKIESFKGNQFDCLNELLDKQIASERGIVERMQNMLTRRSRGKAVAIAVGGTLAALGLAKFVDSILSADTEIASAAEHAIASKDAIPNSTGAVVPGTTPGALKEALEKTVEMGGTSADAEIVNHFEVAEKSGDGIIKVLKDALEARGVENPREVANGIVFNYADEHELSIDKLSHIKSASFDIEPGGKDGFQIKDLKFDALKGHHAAHLGNADHVTQSATYTETHTPMGHVTDHEAVDKAFHQEVNMADPYAGQVEDVYGKINEVNNELNTASVRHVSPPNGSFLHDDDFGPKQVTNLHGGPDVDHIAELANQRETYARMIGQLGAKSESFKGIGESVIKGISGNNIETWRQIKDVSYNEAMSQPAAKARILKTFVKFKGVLDVSEMRPLNGGREEMGAMVKRLTKTLVERGGK